MHEDGQYKECKRILPKERRHEKNWMPWVMGGEIYGLFIGLGIWLMSTVQMFVVTTVGLMLSISAGGRKLFNWMNELGLHWSMRLVFFLAVAIAITSIALLVFGLMGG